MADWSLPRKPRKSNFSTGEVDVLVDAVRIHYNVLYGKFAKRATNRLVRHKAWLDILKKVNGVSVEKRTLQEVKNKWKKCQYAMKEKAVRGTLADDPEDGCDDEDSMPLQERLSKVAAQEKLAGQVLKSQPLSPTKLKVTRQNAKAAKPAEPPPSPANEEMCLRWNSHHSNMQTAFPSILSKEQYVDVTLAAEGKTLKCHRLILSSCSPYFEEILSGISPFQHPVLFMRDIPFWILQSLCDFMYAGEVHIFQNKLEELLTVAEALKIKGLAGKSTPPENQNEPQKTETKPHKDLKKRHQERIQQHAAASPQKRKLVLKHDYYNEDLLDPLDLLEPLYEEAAEEKKPAVIKPKDNKNQYQAMKKPFTRKLRKRKYSEQRDPSPPPVFSFRKGTRSRPNVKIPKYYHTDYSNAVKNNPNAQTDPLLDVDEIKTEPIDVEDNLIGYSDEDHAVDSPIIITSAKPKHEEQFRDIEPVVTEESSTTKGGLEVIKITLQPPEEMNEELERSDPFQGVVIAGSETVSENEEKQTECSISALEITPADVAESENEEQALECEAQTQQDGEQLSNNNSIDENEEQGLHPQIQIKDVRSTCLEQSDEVKATSLDHLEKEAMNVANAINMKSQEGPPDIQ